MLKKRLGLEAIETDWYSDVNLTNYFKIPSTLIIPEGCNRIGKCAFWRCEKLREVVIPESVKDIGNTAFNNCKKLENVIISEGVESIRHFAFSECKSLEKVEIPKSVKEIGSYAFYDCEKTIIILQKPKNEFNEIQIQAFSGCKDVKEETRN